MLYNVILSFEAALIVNLFPARTTTDLVLPIVPRRSGVDGEH